MFGNIIYYDKKKIDEYKAIMNGQRNLEVTEYEVVSDKGMQVGLKALGFDGKASKTYKATMQESLLYDCDEFERMLEGRDDFFDFTESSEHDLSTMRRGYIIKFEGYFKVPEEFDMTHTIDKFKALIISSMIDDGMGESDQELVKAFLKTSDTKVPLLIDLEDQLLCAKLASSNLLIKYEEMEEYEELEVTIVARIISSNSISPKKAFYDPLKDFMTLNRTLRRSMGERGEGLMEICADRDYRMLEVLAIYQ